MKRKFNILFELAFILFFYLTIHIDCQSFLNVEELSVLQYGLEIAKEPVLFKELPEENVMHISSKFGQVYSCKLPEILPHDTEEEKIEKVDPKTVTSILDKSFNVTCQTFNRGWWTYKVCHKKNVTQFHIGGNGEIQGDVTLLGLYDKEDDWKDKNLSDHKTRELYHGVDYVNGSLCELTPKPRKTSVQYYCGEKNDMIIRVEEPAICEYIVTVYSKRLCEHIAFKSDEKLKKFDLICSPALKEKAFNRYQQQKQQKLKIQTQEAVKRQEQMKNNAAELLEKEKEKNNNKIGKETERNNNGDKKDKIWENAAQGLKKMMDKFLDALDPTEVKQDVKTDDLSSNVYDSTEELLNIKEKDLEINDREDTATLAENESIEKTPPTNTMADKSNEKLKIVNKDGDIVDTKIDLDSLQDFVANEIVNFSENDDSLLEMASDQKKALDQEYHKIKEFAEKELVKSRQHSKTLRAFLKGVTDEKQKKELEDMIEKLEVNTKTYEDQISSMNERMENVRKLESETEKKLSEISDELTHAKIVQEVARKLKGFQFENKEQTIAEAVGRIFDKTAALKTKRHVQRTLKPKATLDKPTEEYSSDTKGTTEKGEPKKLFLNELKDEVIKLNQAIQKDTRNTDGTESAEENLEKEATSQNRDDLQVRIRSVDDKMLEKELQEDLEGLDESVREDVKTATKQMEEAVRKQLKASGIDLKDNIKIKVITSPQKFKEFKGQELLSENDAADFKDLFLNFLGGGHGKRTEEKRHQSLQEGYEYVWDDENEEENST